MKQSAFFKQNNISIVFITALIVVISFNFNIFFIASKAVQSALSAIVIFSGAYLLVLNKESIDNNVGEQSSQGRGYILSLSIIVFAGLLLRLWNSTILDPYIDEYNHLLAAQQYLANGEFGLKRLRQESLHDT